MHPGRQKVGRFIRKVRFINQSAFSCASNMYDMFEKYEIS